MIPATIAAIRSPNVCESGMMKPYKLGPAPGAKLARDNPA
jgi:hypothetical protein